MNKYSILLFALLAVGTNSVSAQMSLGYYKFKDGAEYTGELKGRRPNGKGRTVFKNGDVYEGEYVKGNARGRHLYFQRRGEVCGRMVSGPAAWKRNFLFYEQ